MWHLNVAERSVLLDYILSSTSSSSSSSSSSAGPPSPLRLVSLSTPESATADQNEEKDVEEIVEAMLADKEFSIPSVFLKQSEEPQSSEEARLSTHLIGGLLWIKEAHLVLDIEKQRFLFVIEKFSYHGVQSLDQAVKDRVDVNSDQRVKAAMASIRDIRTEANAQLQQIDQSIIEQNLSEEAFIIPEKCRKLLEEKARVLGVKSYVDEESNPSSCVELYDLQDQEIEQDAPADNSLGIHTQFSVVMDVLPSSPVSLSSSSLQNSPKSAILSSPTLSGSSKSHSVSVLTPHSHGVESLETFIEEKIRSSSSKNSSMLNTDKFIVRKSAKPKPQVFPDKKEQMSSDEIHRRIFSSLSKLKAPRSASETAEDIYNIFQGISNDTKRRKKRDWMDGLPL